MNANARSAGKVSARALVGWSLFTIGIVWLALLYGDLGNASGIEGPGRTDPALQNPFWVAARPEIRRMVCRTARLWGLGFAHSLCSRRALLALSLALSWASSIDWTMELSWS